MRDFVFKETFVVLLFVLAEDVCSRTFFRLPKESAQRKGNEEGVRNGQIHPEKCDIPNVSVRTPPLLDHPTPDEGYNHLSHSVDIVLFFRL